MKVIGHNNKIVLAGGKALEAAGGSLPNLFNPSAPGVEHNKRLTSSGGTGNSTGFCVSDYIDIGDGHAGDVITLWQNTAAASPAYYSNTVICGYNSSKSFLYSMKAAASESGSPSGTTADFQGDDYWVSLIPNVAGIKYIRVMGKEDNYSSIKVHLIGLEG